MPCEGASPFSKQFPIFPPITNTHLHAGEGQEDNDLLTQYLYKYVVGPYGTLWDLVSSNIKCMDDNDLLTQYLYKYFVGPYGTLWDLASSNIKCLEDNYLLTQYLYTYFV